MKWSRTSTVNKAAPLGVGDGLAEYPAVGVEDSRQPLDQVLKTDRRRKQRVEPRIPEQFNRRGEAAAVRPPWPVRRRNLSDLTRNQSNPAAVERTSKHRGDGGITIPAHLKYGCPSPASSIAVCSPSGEP